MTECEVCLEPDAKVTLTIQLPELPPHPIAFCDECLRLVFQAMVGRYNAAVDEHNETMRRFFRLLGAEMPA